MSKSGPSARNTAVQQIGGPMSCSNPVTGLERFQRLLAISTPQGGSGPMSVAHSGDTPPRVARTATYCEADRHLGGGAAAGVSR